MNAISPYHLFSPIHLAWLYRRHEQKLDVTASDLDSIEAEQPEAVHDPLFADYRSRANAEKLHRRRGRKPMTPSHYLRLWHARFEILDEMDAIRSRRERGLEQRMRGDPEPCYLAAETVARRMRFPFSGRWLVKKISKLGIR